MAERLKAAVLKTARGATLSWVRIPPHPPFIAETNSKLSRLRQSESAGYHIRYHRCAEYGPVEGLPIAVEAVGSTLWAGTHVSPQQATDGPRAARKKKLQAWPAAAARFETHLVVRDLKRSIAFYRDVFGLEFAFGFGQRLRQG